MNDTRVHEDVKTSLSQREREREREREKERERKRARADTIISLSGKHFFVSSLEVGQLRIKPHNPARLNTIASP